MQKEFCFSNKPQITLWDSMWTTRAVEKELEACDLETPARDSFLTYIPKGGKVIDGGCGFGKWVIYLKKLGYDITGIDNNEIAIAKLKEYDPSLQVEMGDILDIHQPDSSFDAYISMGVVEHFEDGPLPALREAHRILKPGGLIFVSVPTVNIMRKFIKRPLRILINVLPMTAIAVKSNWGKSKKRAFLAAAISMSSILPQKLVGMAVRILFRGEGWYYHFLEYRYSRAELENFLKQSGFEVIKGVPHDLYGAKGYAAGLFTDFPFLAARNGANFRLNPLGQLISQMFIKISPWVACSSVLCVGRSLKTSSK